MRNHMFPIRNDLARADDDRRNDTAISATRHTAIDAQCTPLSPMSQLREANNLRFDTAGNVYIPHRRTAYEPEQGTTSHGLKRRLLGKLVGLLDVIGDDDVVEDRATSARAHGPDASLPDQRGMPTDKARGYVLGDEGRHETVESSLKIGRTADRAATAISARFETTQQKQIRRYMAPFPAHVSGHRPQRVPQAFQRLHHPREVTNTGPLDKTHTALGLLRGHCSARRLLLLQPATSQHAEALHALQYHADAAPCGFGRRRRTLDLPDVDADEGKIIKRVDVVIRDVLRVVDLRMHPRALVRRVLDHRVLPPRQKVSKRVLRMPQVEEQTTALRDGNTRLRRGRFWPRPLLRKQNPLLQCEMPKL
eukprot:gene191-biopygen212